MTDPQEQHSVSSATYPIPEPITERLEAGILSETGRNGQVDSFQEGLSHLVSNSIEAMDAMYFATPGAFRKHPAFQHRLCLRVKADPDTKSISLTDLGVGMTRGDLINSLGIGKPMASKQQSDDDDSTTDEEETDDDMENPAEDVKEEAKSQDSSRKESANLSCKGSDIGGFYAALCALGVGVRVATKSKFDDYYIMEVGQVRNANGTTDNGLKEFSIQRPYDEGTELNVENGFDQFESVRGESGTCVTIFMNDQAVDAGYLDENNLKPIFLKIVETTQYTIAFSTGDDCNKIIEASAVEKKAREEFENEPIETSDPLDAVANIEISSSNEKDDYNSVKERSKYIPIRLSLGERKMLRLVEATMHCCDYTTEVDQPFKNSARRLHEQLKGITSILRGLVTACDYKAGQKLLEDDDFSEYEDFYRQMFEIARRHKIMNPEKMRTEYGKLVYILQDAVSPSVRPHLGFSVKGPILSVYRFLEERGGLMLLEDSLIETATEEILAGKKSRAQIDSEIRAKEKAVRILKKKYQTTKLSAEDIHLCLYSICDNNSFLNSNRVPIDKIIEYMTSHFSPDRIEEGYSLAIVSGEEGSRLSHSHHRQYYYALQSLTLWRDIIDDMFRLWAMAEDDLLSDSVTYSMQDTGQGMQRVQQSPRTYKAMQRILSRVQSKVSHWVGSNMIHLGDHNVPNALSFIDKYTQVPRILGPIVSCLDNVERIYEEDDGVKAMIDDGYGGLEQLRKDILYDFFRSAFDGSGADNFYDAGSCIDGRLTSAWNWCSQLPTKRFYPIFKLTGFIGFDGDFK